MLAPHSVGVVDRIAKLVHQRLHLAGKPSHINIRVIHRGGTVNGECRPLSKACGARGDVGFRIDRKTKALIQLAFLAGMIDSKIEA